MPLPKSEYDSTIYKILPKDLSEYFFFWGERIENLDKKKNISKAVRDFLGLTAIDNAKKHLSTARESFMTKLAQEVGSSNKSMDLEDKLNKLTRNMDIYLSRIDEANANIKSFKAKKEKYEKELLNNASSAEAADNLKKTEVNIVRQKENIDRDFKNIINAFNQNNYLYFSAPMEEVLMDTLDHLPKEDKGLVHQTAKSIMELINRGTCVCGADLSEGTDAFNHVMEEFNKIPPKSIYAQVKDFKKDFNRMQDLNKNYTANLLLNVSNYRDNIEVLTDLNGEVQELKDRIDTNVDTKELQRKKDLYERKFVNASNVSVTNQSYFDRDMKEKDRLERRIHSYATSTANAKKIQSYIDYIDAVLKDISNDYDAKESDIKARLNELVKTYFKQMYHGVRNVSVDNNYRIQLTSEIDGKAIKTEESPGLQTVKNFAFIAALVEFAKERKSNLDEGDMDIEPYPLVLDAPFSQADEVHVPNICKLISGVAEQTILVVMEKDWNYAKDTMIDKVGKFYEISKTSETHSEIVPAEVK